MGKLRVARRPDCDSGAWYSSHPKRPCAFPTSVSHKFSPSPGIPVFPVTHALQGEREIADSVTDVGDAHT